MPRFTESVVEDAALSWFAGLGYTILSGYEIAPGEPAAERASYGDVILAGRLRAALARLNPDLPAAALDEAYRKLTRPESPSLLLNNRAMHRMLIDGATVEYRTPAGDIKAGQVRVLDPDGRNDYVAVNQFTIQEGGQTRRPDIVVFVNGLPLAVIELKTPRIRTRQSGPRSTSSSATRSRSPRCFSITR